MKQVNETKLFVVNVDSSSKWKLDIEEPETKLNKFTEVLYTIRENFHVHNLKHIYFFHFTLI